MIKEFASIRQIEEHQVLCYTESNDEGSSVHILCRTTEGVNANMTLTYPSDEAMDICFESFKNGELDETLSRQIKGWESIAVEDAEQ